MKKKNISGKFHTSFGLHFLYSILVLLMLAFCLSVSSRADDEVDTDALQASIDEKEEELDNLAAQKSALQAGKANVQNIINNLRANRQELANYVAELDQEIETISSNIENYNTLIAEKEAEIANTEAELQTAIEVAENQYNAMKARIRFMYERGDVAYLEMLLSANSFADMLNKADYIEALSAYDRRKLEEYCLVIEYTRLVEEELEEEREVLEEAKTAAEEDAAAINELIQEKQEQIVASETDINTQQQAINEYDAEISAQNQIIAELEAQVAAERAALEEANRRHYSGGVFAWPCPSYTRISDEYGWRMHPTLNVRKFHNGIDMAAPGGSPILAAYDGDVVAAGYSSSMGNYIMIDHGDGLYTIYMHASALYVSKGQEVSRGQTIAAVGSTGRSTGNHLHFGVRLNGEYVDPNSYL